MSFSFSEESSCLQKRIDDPSFIHGRKLILTCHRWQNRAAPYPTLPSLSSIQIAMFSTESRRGKARQGNRERRKQRHIQFTILCSSVRALNLDASMEFVGGYMVAFAGAKYAARSVPAFVGNNSLNVTSFTLHRFLSSRKGGLRTFTGREMDVPKCSGNGNFVCLNKQDSAIKTQNCKSQGGQADCRLGIQLAFSGTDKYYSALNSWYEVANLRQYSLFGLYSNLRNSLTSQFNNIF